MRGLPFSVCFDQEYVGGIILPTRVLAVDPCVHTSVSECRLLGHALLTSKLQRCSSPPSCFLMLQKSLRPEVSFFFLHSNPDFFSLPGHFRYILKIFWSPDLAVIFGPLIGIFQLRAIWKNKLSSCIASLWFALRSLRQLVTSMLNPFFFCTVYPSSFTFIIIFFKVVFYVLWERFSSLFSLLEDNGLISALLVLPLTD